MGNSYGLVRDSRRGFPESLRILPASDEDKSILHSPASVYDGDKTELFAALAVMPFNATRFAVHRAYLRLSWISDRFYPQVVLDL